jgi:hypothetical protein
MARAGIEGWPGAPLSRPYTADGRPNTPPPGWQPPAREDQDRISAFIRERVRQHRAEANQRHVREALAARQPETARKLERAARAVSPRAGRESR